MPAPTNILVPIDFSANAEQALDYAVELGRKLGAKVHLVNAIGLPLVASPELGLPYSVQMLDNMTVENKKGLDELAAARADTVGQTIVRNGDARDVILHAAEEVRADLIVMGTHGRRGISRALLGSVAESIVRTSPVPVLTIRSKS